MKKIAFFLLILFSVGALVANAQTRELTGKVTSVEDNMPIPGVSVSVAGTTLGTITDIDGNFVLKVPESARNLVVSFVGMKSRTIEIGTSTEFNIALEPDLVGIDEVVVTALGISRKEKTLGYASQSVAGEALAEVKSTDVMASLSGKVAGVQVSGSAGNMGGSTMVRIRGVNSITGNNNPLYVIDGTPVSNANFNTSGTQSGSGGFDYGNLIQDVNADDIESMTVLKGPAATAMYGSRGANGVIMITTKSGGGKKGIGVEFNTNITMNNVYILPEYQDEYGGGYTQTFAEYNGEKVVNYSADESWGPKMDGTPVRHWSSWFENSDDYGKTRPFSPNPDNIRDFYNTGLVQNYNVAVNGGTDKTSMRLSVSYMDHKDVMPEANMEKTTIAFNSSHQVNDKIKVWYSGSYIRNHAKGRPRTGYDFATGRNVQTSFNQWFQRQIDMDRLERLYQSNGGLPQSWNISSPTNLKPLYWDNPFWVINTSYTEDRRNRFYGNVNVSYNPIQNLLFTASARTDYYDFNVEDRVATYSLSQDYYEETVRRGREDNYELMVNYNGEINEDITYSVNAQGNIRVNTYSRQGGHTNGGLSVPNYFNINASIDRPGVNDWYDEKQVNSTTFFGNIGYKDILFLDASYRMEWSSALPVDNNFYQYPSVNGSFLFTELIESSILSFGKLRAGWAKVGNDTAPYRVHNTYGLSSNPYGSMPAAYVPSGLNNPNLVPEEISSWEVGADLRFLEGRIGLDLTYYDKVSRNLIVPADISGATGYTSAWINAGEMQNKGVEIALNGTPVDKKNFKWDIGLNWAKNNNTVIKIIEGLDVLTLGSWGPSVNAIEGETYGTWIADGFKYFQAWNDTNGDGEMQDDEKIDHENNGKRILDVYTKDGVEQAVFARETNKYLGSYLPDFTGGVTNTLSFGGISVSAHIDFQKGGNIYSVSNRYGTYSGLLATTVGTNDKGNGYRDPVTEGGGVRVDGVDEDGNTLPGYYTDAKDYFKHFRTRREYYIYDASYVKLREMSVSYTLPSSLFAKTAISSMKVSLVGRNLWLIHSNAPNIDPEASLGSGNVQGFENGQIPSVRSIGFNLNVKF